MLSNPLIRILLAALFASLALMATSCQTTDGNHTGPKCGKPISTQAGTASFYSIRTNSGVHTASGKPLSDNSLTAAHRTLPFGTPVRVTNTANGKSVVVTITDRGPYVRGRIIDLTVAAARELDFIKRGLVPVKVEVLPKPDRA